MQGADDAVAGADSQVPMEQQEQYMAALSEALSGRKKCLWRHLSVLENSAQARSDHASVWFTV